MLHREALSVFSDFSAKHSAFTSKSTWVLITKIEALSYSKTSVIILESTQS